MKENSLRQFFGTVYSCDEPALHALLINLAVASGKGNMVFIRKQHIQIENNPGSTGPQAQQLSSWPLP
jgi:hypothetical protein